MGKNKSCGSEKREDIIKLHKKNLSYRRIADILGCSKTMVYNAVQHFKKFGVTNNIPRKQRSRKTTTTLDSRIVILSKRDPKKSAVEIRNEICSQNDVNISVHTVRRRLVEAGLNGRIMRKKPNVNKATRKKRLEFVVAHGHWTTREWKRVLFSDETKINRIGSDGKRYVRRPPKKELDPRYTSKIVKFGGGNVMVWGSFSWKGVGPLYRINGRMDQDQYIHILENVMEPYAFRNMPVNWLYQHDNDPKHTAGRVKTWLQRQSIIVLDWPSNSPDLNPIENLWHQVKSKVGEKNYGNLDDLFEAVKQAWEAIPIEYCQNLIKSMPKRCQAVKDNKGYPTKY